MNHLKQKLDSEVVILALGYATCLFIVVGWIATLVI